MKKSKIVYVSLVPWGTFPGSKDRLSKEKNNFITGKYWDHNYAVYGLIKSYITRKKLYYPKKKKIRKPISPRNYMSILFIKLWTTHVHQVTSSTAKISQASCRPVVVPSSKCITCNNSCVSSAKRMCKGQRSTAMPWESTVLLSMNCFNEYNCSSLYVVCFVWLILIFEEMFSGCSSFLKIRWYTNSIINLNRV